MSPRHALPAGRASHPQSKFDDLIARRPLDILPHQNLTNIYPVQWPNVFHFLGVIVGDNLRGVLGGETRKPDQARFICDFDLFSVSGRSKPFPLGKNHR